MHLYLEESIICTGSFQNLSETRLKITYEKKFTFNSIKRYMTLASKDQNRNSMTLSSLLTRHNIKFY